MRDQIARLEVMFVGTTKSLESVKNVTSVNVAGTSLPVTNEIKSLCVILDSRLNLDSHVRAVCKSCRYHTLALWHIRHLISEDSAQTLASSIVMSRLDYCNSLLYGMPEYVLNKLKSVQNTLARVVTRSDARTSAAPLLVKLHWLPIRQRISYKLATLTFRVRTISTPQYLSSLLSVPRSTGYSLRSTDRPLLTVPRTRTSTARRLFSCAGPLVWNTLSDSVVYCDTFRGFKRKLKMHLTGLATN